MKQIFADYIDQLDLALDQIAYNDRNIDRFSLLLIDNVMELFLYQYANDCNREKSMWSRDNEEKYDSKLLNKALGKYFDDKVKFAVETNFIESDTGNAIKYLHSFRNSAYHEGKRHESILHSLTIFYFKLTCQTICSYKPSYWSVSSLDKISHRAMKYLGEDSFPFNGKECLRAFVRLEQVANHFEEDLVGDLLNDLSKVVETIHDEINFIAKDSPRRMTRIEAVIESQGWHYAFTDECKKFASDKINISEMPVFQYVEWIKENYTQIYKFDPINSWRRVLAKLEKVKDYKSALKLYCDFLSESEKLRNIIDEAAFSLDIHIHVNVNEFLYHLIMNLFTSSDHESVYHSGKFDHEFVYH